MTGPGHKPGPKPKGGHRRASFSFRLRNDLRERLEASAEAFDRPLAEEIEARLQYSFDHPSMVQSIRHEIRLALGTPRE